MSLKAVEPAVASLPRRRAPRAKSITLAARSGDRRRLLVALRDHIAKQIDDGVGARELTPLSRRLVALALEIEAIDASAKSLVVEAAETLDEQWAP